MGLFSGFIDSLRRLFGSSGSEYSGGGAGGSRLYVGNLSYQVKEEQLRELFSKYGRIKTLHLIRDRISRRLKGYAFLEMAPDDAQKALALNGITFLDRKIVVSLAKAKRGENGGGGEGGRSQRRGGGNNQRFRRRRSGPRAYGSQGGSEKENTQIQRLE